MPTNDNTPLPERATSSYLQLSEVAKKLNAVSDELGKAVAQIDNALKKLNLGVEVWVKIAHRPADQQLNNFWDEADRLGYAKVNGKWGIAIETVAEDIRDGEARIETWLFNDAPRKLRLLAIDRIADLLDELAKTASKTEDEIRGRLSDAHAVADAVAKAAGERIPVRGMPPPPTAPTLSGKAGAK